MRKYRITWETDFGEPKWDYVNAHDIIEAESEKEAVQIFKTKRMYALINSVKEI
jgi:hypothetical protein